MNSAMSAQSAIPAPGGVPQEIFTAHQAHLSGSDLASRWGMSPRTLERWRMEGRGPIYLKLGKRVAYSMSTVRTSRHPSGSSTDAGQMPLRP